jgi:hypothetical protein
MTEKFTRSQVTIRFERDGIAPGAAADIECFAPEGDLDIGGGVLFRGERLAIGDSVANHFHVLDITVGTQSELARGRRVAAAVREDEDIRKVRSLLEAMGRALPDEAPWEVAFPTRPRPPGTVITLRVQNVDTVPHDFRAVLHGDVLVFLRRS